MKLRRVDNPPNPYLSQHVEWLEPPPEARIEVYEETSGSIISRNDSPDVPFTWSVNPYRGCQHACCYCYARTYHEYLGYGEQGAAQAESLGFEVDYLSRWLPSALGESETRKIVAAAIAGLGVEDPKMAGRVVGHIMKSGIEGIDGGLVNRLVREALGAE